MHNGNYNNYHPSSHHHRFSHDQPLQRGTNRPFNNHAGSTRGFGGRNDRINNWVPRRDDRWGMSEEHLPVRETGQQYMNARNYGSQPDSYHQETQPQTQSYCTGSDNWNAITPEVDEWGRDISGRRRSPEVSEDSHRYEPQDDVRGYDMHARSYSDGRKRQRSSSMERKIIPFAGQSGFQNFWDQQDDQFSPKRPRISERAEHNQGWERQRRSLPSQELQHRQTLSTPASANKSTSFKAVYVRKEVGSNTVPSQSHFGEQPTRATYIRPSPVTHHPPTNYEHLSAFPNEFSRGISAEHEIFRAPDDHTRDFDAQAIPIKKFSPPKAPRAMTRNFETKGTAVHTDPQHFSRDPHPMYSGNHRPPFEKHDQSQHLPLVPPTLNDVITQIEADPALAQISSDIISIIKQIQANPAPASVDPEPSVDPKPPVDPEPPSNPVLKSEKAKPIDSEEPFEFLNLVGVGSYGVVFKARDKQNGQLFALKKIKTESQRDGFPVTALREIKILQSLHHENVVSLREMVIRKGAIFLSFEYLEHDLVGLLRQTVFELKPEHMKSLTQQLLQGLEYLHGKGILHRDLKAANLLITRDGALKLGDFGLARLYNKRKQANYTNNVCTLLYRSPELMLGETVYGPEIDIWSAGCIFLELFLKKTPFEGRHEIDQLGLIYSTFGSPNDKHAQCLMHKPWYNLMEPSTRSDNCFRAKYASILSGDALEFAESMLDLDGSKRPSATAALDHHYFRSIPYAVRPDLTPLNDDFHEYEQKEQHEEHKPRVK